MRRSGEPRSFTNRGLVQRSAVDVVRDPFAVAEKLFDLVVAGFEDAGVLLPGSGEEDGVQYVAPGNVVAYDGPQFTTNVLRLYRGEPGVETDADNFRKPLLWTCELQAMILRDTPVLMDDGSPPSPESLTANARQNIQDVTVLRNVMYAIVTGNLLTDHEPNMRALLGPVATVGPAGGLVGASGQISVTLT